MATSKQDQRKNAAVSPRQAEALAWIVDATAELGYPPNQSDLAKGLSVSAPTAHKLVEKLREAKVLRRVPNKPYILIVDGKRAAAVLFIVTVRRVLAGDKKAAAPDVQGAINAAYESWLNHVA